MASIRKQLTLPIPPEAAWDALRDVGAVHTRLARGFVTDCRMDGPDRIVTFANGLSARELIVDLDDAARRIAYSARSERLVHHHATLQVLPDGAGCRLVWITDVLPHEAAARAGQMMDAGFAAMRETLAPHSEAA
jgi:Polyketide cyclase / dehydrase and lipid transport